MANILLIENEIDLRDQVAEYLSYEGFDVICAANGVEGLEMAQANHPDLIVSDIAMPVMDGYGVLAELQKQPEMARIPFIFLSAKAERLSVRHGMELGADDYVTKPFTAEELIGAIRSRLRKQEIVVQATTYELDRIKTQLAKTVSVDLRTPVASIMATQRILADQWGTLSLDEVNQLFNTLQDNSHQLHHVIEQMVWLTQFESGALTPDRLNISSVEIDWLHLLGAAINLTHQFTARNIDKAVKLRAVERDAVIQCHLQSLAFAIAEAIVNVLAFSAEGYEVVITQWTRDDVAWLRILANNGRADLPEEIDEPLNAQNANDIGLSLARRVVEAHGGRLEFRSGQGQPTGVLIQLPTQNPA